MTNRHSILQPSKLSLLDGSSVCFGVYPIKVFGDVVIFFLFLRCHYLHPQRLRAAFPRSPFQFLLLAQNDLCLGPDFWGAFRLLPVARLYLARPFAVKPPPALTDCFSPRPTDKLGPFFLGILSCPRFVNDECHITWFCIFCVGN